METPRQIKRLLYALTVLFIILGLTVGEAPARSAGEYFQEGLRSYYRENFDRARIFFQRAVNEEPDNPRHHFFLGNVFARLNRKEQAELAYRKALDLEPGYTTARRRLAFLYFDNRQWSEAAEQFQRLLRESPREYEYRFHHAVSLFEMEELDLARDEFFRARELRRDAAETHYYLGRISLLREEYTTAVNRFTRALDYDGSQGRYYFYRGLAYFRQEDYRRPPEEWQSNEDFQRAIDLNYDTARTRFLLGNSLMCRGLFLLQQERSQEAIDFLQQSIRQFRRVLINDPEASNAYHNLGVAYLGIGKLDLAASALREAIELEPEIAFFQDSLGLVYYRRGDFSRALSTWSFVREIDPDYSRHPLGDLLDIEALDLRKREARIRR